jgi:hypothetical protein
MALRRTRDGFAVDPVKPKGVDRPWSPAMAGDTEAETILVTPSRRRVPLMRRQRKPIGRPRIDCRSRSRQNLRRSWYRHVFALPAKLQLGKGKRRSTSGVS